MKIKCPVCNDEFSVEEIKNHLATSLSNKEVLKLIDAYVDRELKIHENIEYYSKRNASSDDAVVRVLQSLLEDRK